MGDTINIFPEKYRSDIETATKILLKYGCSAIFIFGSLVNGKINENSDIDIAVKGLKDELFFKVYAELRKALEYDIDLLDLDDEQNRFSKFILEKGELIQVA